MIKKFKDYEINENYSNYEGKLPDLIEDELEIQVTIPMSTLMYNNRHNRIIVEMVDGTFHTYEVNSYNEGSWHSMDYGKGIDGNREIIFDQDIIPGKPGWWEGALATYFDKKGMEIKNVYLGEI